jgi:hypothetical protein
VNTEDKKRIDALIGDLLSKIARANADVVKAKQALKAKLAEVEKFKATFSEQENANRREKAQAEFTEAVRALYEPVAVHIEELQEAINQRHAELDMSDPRWINTLKMIELGVSDPTTIQRLVGQFEHNQPALQALRDVMKAHKMPYDGGIDKMIYDVEGAFQGLKEAAYQTFLQGNTSVTAFASKVGKLAGLEGFQFETSPDPDAFEEALYRGASMAAGVPMSSE